MASSAPTAVPPSHPSASHPHTHTAKHPAPHPHPHILKPPTPPLSSPSSPSSTHSSSSAIFERDIEPLALSSLPAPRDHTLAAFVPSVLDEAVEALTASSVDGGMGDFEVELAGNQNQAQNQSSNAPSSMEGEDPSAYGYGFRRSPSPPGIPAAASLAAAAPAARPSLPERQSTTPFIPGGFNPHPPAPPTLSVSGLTTPPSPSASGNALDPIAGLTSAALPATPAATARTPSAAHAQPSKRLSFVSYSDLLLSSPITSLPLSQVTQPQHVPPHLSSLGPMSAFGMGMAAGAGGAAGSASASVGVGRSREQSTYGDEGGEWEREGLGKGLEERLEEVLKAREA